jgi:hypothetical protein
MSERFKEFLLAEIECMRRECAHASEAGEDAFNALALVWIEENAERFRQEWERRQQQSQELLSTEF